MKSRFLFQKQSTPQRMKKAVFSQFESFPNQKKQIYQNQLYFNSPNQNKINQREKNRNKRPKSSIYSSYTELKLNYPIISKKEQDMVFNNLYNDSIYRKEKLRKLSQEKERRFNTIYTFSPKINNEKYNNRISNSYNKIESHIFDDNNSYNYSYSNFINRLYIYQKKRKENLKKIKQEIYSSSPHPKKKKMNLKYFKLPYNSQKFLNIKNQNIKKLSDEILNEQGVTFKPKLNDNVNYMIKKKFFQRSLDFQKSREIKLNSAKEDTECTFSPKINYDNSIIQNHNQNMNDNPIKINIGERLYNYQNEYKKNLEKIKIKNEKFYSFQPKISKNTNSILENRKRINNLIKQGQLFDENSKELINTENNNEQNNNSIKQEIKNELYDNQIKVNMKKKINPKSNQINNENFKKYYIVNNDNIVINKSPILLNLYDNQNYEKNIKKISKIYNLENPFSRNKNLRNNKKVKTGRNVFSNITKHISNGFSNDEKERPTTNCSTVNSKSIVNFNYYDILK